MKIAFMPDTHFGPYDQPTLPTGPEVADAMEHCIRESEIAERCNAAPPVGLQVLPTFPTPQGMSANDYLRHLCQTELPRPQPMTLPMVVVMMLSPRASARSSTPIRGLPFARCGRGRPGG